MKYKYTVEELEVLDKKQYEVKKRIRLGGMSIQDAIDETQAILDKTRKPKAQQVLDLHSYPIWWTGVEAQVEVVRQFLNEHGCCVPIPSFPEHFQPQTNTEVPMLMPYLARSRSKEDTQRTFDALWKFIEAPKGFAKYVWDGFSSDEEHLRMFGLGNPKPLAGVRWIGYDPCANRDDSVRSCWDNWDFNSSLGLAGPEVLMAAKLFPDYVSTLGAGDCPNPIMAGYQFKYGINWNTVPYLDLVRIGAHYMRLCVDNNIDTKSYGWACPTVREL